MDLLHEHRSAPAGNYSLPLIHTLEHTWVLSVCHAFSSLLIMALNGKRAPCAAFPNYPGPLPKLCYDTVSRPFYPETGTHLGPMTVRQLGAWWSGLPSLTRGLVCILKLLLGLSNAVILGSTSRRTSDCMLTKTNCMELNTAREATSCETIR
jgi:hypothetical protein